MNLTRIKSEIGNPNSIDSDPRAGFDVVWGSRETGCFLVHKMAFGDLYEVVLIPAPNLNTKSWLKKENMAREELNIWFESNIVKIKDTLAGKNCFE